MNIDELLHLINSVSASALTEFQYEENGLVISMKKDSAKITVCDSVNAPKAVTENPEHMTTEIPQEKQYITSPLVGTFYAAPSEDSEPFVKIGDSITKGQTLAIVEAMKLMNDIESEFDGVITEILVENGQAVEYGQPLFCIC